MVPSRPQASTLTFAGLFFTTLSTLMYEVLLTRIFSVTMWYHFAFVAVSVALFGMTVGALAVHLLPRHFPQERTSERLAQASLLFSLSIVGSFLLHLRIPFDPAWSARGVGFAAATYLVIAVPFVFSGIAVCLSLTRFPAQISRLYAVDLLGAALGTTTLIWLLDVMRDAPSAVLAVAALAAIGATLYSRAARISITALASALAVIALACLAGGNVVAARHQQPFLRITNVKGAHEGVPIWETWNAFSRIRVDGDPEVLSEETVRAPDGASAPLRRLGVTIDATAGTVLTGYDGDPDSVSFVRDDVVSLAHTVRPNSRVLIIGVGGGGEVLLALHFRQPSITAVEMNGAVLEAVNERFAGFTGHLDGQPGVRFVNDEGRAFVARSGERYDIIQIPFTDTWAATAAGAFSLSENGLYTVDAWETFYDHLSSRGVLTVTRWHFEERPMEAYRLTALAVEALRRGGIAAPREHIILLRGAESLPGVAVANILVSREPFAPADIAQVKRAADLLRAEVLLAPDSAGSDPLFAEIAEKEIGDIDFGFPGDLSAPTDDRPFFFQMVRFRDLFDTSLYGGANDYVARPVLVLFSLSIAVLAMTALFILAPLALTTTRSALRGTLPLVVFFSAIGLGFLLLEIAQMQRLIIFLGHPTYALSVVLFSLLLFSGVGSLTTEWLVTPKAGVRPALLAPIGLLLLVLLFFGFATTAAIDRFEAQTTGVRIMAAVGILAPMGLVMGMPFPLGMKVASLRPEAPTAFFWGINGATSVCASVLAVAVSMGWGISMAFWAGVGAYAVAALAIAWVVLRGMDRGLVPAS